MKIATGIYRDVHGIRAVVDIAAGRKEKRFDRSAKLADIKRWRNQTKVKLEARHPTKRAGAIGRGTFNADVRRYLKHLAIASWKSRRSELRAWAAAGLGRLKRARITADHAKAIIKRWADGDAAATPPIAPVPPKTIHNRVLALKAMYHDLDGDAAWTPADGATLPAMVSKSPDYVTPTQINVVRAALEQQEATASLDPRWRARYLVLAATGERPVFLRRAQPHDVDLERGEWRMHGAKGGKPIRLPLNGDMVAAWRVFIAVAAWGPFDPTDYANVLRAAGWPQGIRPYALKHSLSQDMADAGVDLETIADWHGHTGGFKTTRIYTGFAWKKLKLASEAIDGRLGWAPPAPPVEESPKNLPVDLGRLTADEAKALLKQLLERL